MITDDSPDPAAASLLDLVRATVVFEEPYALACFVKYVQKTMRVVRLKNRFEHDVAERISAARLQQEFYAAEAWGYEDADVDFVRRRRQSTSTRTTTSTARGRRQHGDVDVESPLNDVMLNVEV